MHQMPDDTFPVDPPFSPEHFTRGDPSDDARFYDSPRLVTHIDDTAIAIIGEILAELIPPDATILDLMSSWKSHLPPQIRPRRVVGLGLNGTELAANDQLDAWVVHDLNANPALSFADDEFDIAIITVSIQYVTRPVTLFREIRRVLKPGAPLVIFFSNRLFPTKAVRIWTQLDDAGHIALVQSYSNTRAATPTSASLTAAPSRNSAIMAGSSPCTTRSTPSSARRQEQWERKGRILRCARDDKDEQCRSLSS